jgi:hypothetical protein
MAGLTPIAGTHHLTRVVPVPSAELERLPPASPLPDPNQAANPKVAPGSEESDVGGATRFTPPEPAELTAADPVTTQQAGGDPTAVPAGAGTSEQALPVEPTDSSQSIGAYLDLFA